MIKNEPQYCIIKTQVLKFEQALPSLDNYSTEQKNENLLLWETQKSAIGSQLYDLKAELEEYEALSIGRERLRQARISFNIASGITVASAIVSVIGAVLVLMGSLPDGGIIASVGGGVSLVGFRFAKEFNDRLDKLAIEFLE